MARSVHLTSAAAALVGLLFVATPASATVASATMATTVRVSLSSAGVQGTGRAMSPAISANGRYVAFEWDVNGRFEIFRRDLVTGATRRVDVSSTGVGATASNYPAISADGRFVAFMSYASNLVPGDTNGVTDIFVRDMVSSTTQRVSVSSSGAQGRARSTFPAISADGRYVAFASFASNLVAGDTNHVEDVFRRNLVTGKTQRVSVSSTGAQGSRDSGYTRPAISATGRFIAFDTASALVAGDDNGRLDIYMHDRLSATTERVSVSSTGAQEGYGADSSTPAISADGTSVAFESTAANLVPGDTNGSSDVFVRDRSTGTTWRASRSSAGVQGNGWSFSAAISGDGRYVSFTSQASNLVAGDTDGFDDVFVRDRTARTTQLVSVPMIAVEADGDDPAISADGRFVAFVSWEPLIADDTNQTADVYLRGPLR
jgi:Tol biopolymer transport system component